MVITRPLPKTASRKERQEREERQRQGTTPHRPKAAYRRSTSFGGLSLEGTRRRRSDTFRIPRSDFRILLVCFCLGVFFDVLVDLGSVGAQDSRGGGDVAVGLVQGAFDERFFGFLQVDRQIGCGGLG